MEQNHMTLQQEEEMAEFLHNDRIYMITLLNMYFNNTVLEKI